jgi:hypothetical protein
MLASISPVGEASRQQRWPVTVIAYLAGSVAGGLAIGTVAGAVGAGLAAVVGGSLPPTAVVVVLLVVGALGLAVDQGLVPGRLPSWRRQVDEGWLTAYRGWVYGAGFGFQLGTGVLTRIPTVATHLMLLAAVGTGSIPDGALVGTAFGLVRALPLLLARSLTDPVRLNRFHARMEGATRPVERGARAAVLVSLVAAGAAVAAM